MEFYEANTPKQCVSITTLLLYCHLFTVDVYVLSISLGRKLQTTEKPLGFSVVELLPNSQKYSTIVLVITHVIFRGSPSRSHPSEPNAKKNLLLKNQPGPYPRIVGCQTL